MYKLDRFLYSLQIIVGCICDYSGVVKMETVNFVFYAKFGIEVRLSSLIDKTILIGRQISTPPLQQLFCWRFFFTNTRFFLAV